MLPFELTKDTPYLALSGELWSVIYEYFNRNWPCYKGFLLYFFLTHTCYGVFCSMAGGELFSRIQERADTAFTERGQSCGFHYSKKYLLQSLD